ERFRRIASGNHVGRHSDTSLVKHAVADCHSVAVLLVEPLTLAQIDKTFGEARLLLRVDRAAWRKLEKIQPQLVDRGRPVIDDLVDRTRAGDSEERRRRAEGGTLRIDPNAELLGLFAYQDRLGRTFEHHDDVVRLLRPPTLRVQNRAVKQQLGAGEALAHPDLVLGNFWHQDRIALPAERYERHECEQNADHNGSTE